METDIDLLYNLLRDTETPEYLKKDIEKILDLHQKIKPQILRVKAKIKLLDKMVDLLAEDERFFDEVKKEWDELRELMGSDYHETGLLGIFGKYKRETTNIKPFIKHRQ